MNFVTFLASLLLVLRLRKQLRYTSIYSKWSGLLNFSLYAVVAIFLITESYLRDELNVTLGGALLFAMVRYGLAQPDLRSYYSHLRDHYVLAVSVFLCGATALLFPVFYDEWQNYFEFTMLGAFIWIMARWFTSRKQFEELRITSERKAELEKLVAERTAELTLQKNELQETVKELKATQAQLIQQEKLASLGELTAGIAHEIQNPLNFVNNFSEVSAELLEELRTGPLEKLPEEERSYADEILTDLTQNLEKIAHHGKRADSIVKGMLQHSRAGAGQKEPVDINALADEYLRLSYHGCRAKDKTFNASIVVNADAEIGEVNLIRQDIGRVLLNLFNNSFYSVSDKKKKLNGEYQPEVSVTTKKLDDAIEIRVRDNGMGVPPEVMAKIFQPFFTTKPTGQGTGLGLSLSYDIITKGHGGELSIDTEEGQFAEFAILLPTG
jgi:two-component system, NtrC family, sensor kinase